jgi:TolA-binding protein
LQEEVTQLRGALEESNHKNRPEQHVKPLQEEIALLKTRLTNQEESLTTLKAQSDEQKKYLEQVLATLEKLNLELTKDTKKSKKKDSNKLATLKDANLLFKAKKLPEAKEQYQDILGAAKKAAEKAEAIHYLGIISYLEKDYDAAIAHLSTLFNDYPKSSFLSSGMLVLAKCFQKNKMKAESKQTLDELISRFPKAREAKEAKELLSKL